jgi:hypothetical protein
MPDSELQGLARLSSKALKVQFLFVMFISIVYFWFLGSQQNNVYRNRSQNMQLQQAV